MEYVLLKDDDDDVNVAGDEVLKIGNNDETLDINSAKSLQCACMVMLVLDKPSRACHFERTIVKLGNFLTMESSMSVGQSLMVLGSFSRHVDKM